MEKVKNKLKRIAKGDEVKGRRMNIDRINTIAIESGISLAKAVFYYQLGLTK